jgi:beta-fructofuranosidase
MSLRLPDDWVWDFWTATDGEAVHLFYLKAPRSLGDPDLRHWHARVGHAVSRDLVDWAVLPDALGPGAPGAFDDRSIWTGSIVRRGDRWLMFYTGLSHGDGGAVQRIGCAESRDLTTWRRTGSVLEADPRWYETALAPGDDEHWRDPWAFVGPDGAIHLLITARARDGETDGRGVVAHAWTQDLERWTVGPPVSEPGWFRQLEVPQLFEDGGRWFLLTNAWLADHGPRRTQQPGFRRLGGSFVLPGDGPLGPFHAADAQPLVADERCSLYAGRLVRARDEWHHLAWRNVDPDGSFIGEIANPTPVARVGDTWASAR